MESISVIGISHVFNRERHTVARVAWLLLICAGCAMLLYQIQDRVTYYLQYPTNVDLNVVTVSELPFPTLLLCNNDNRNGTWMKQHLDIAQQDNIWTDAITSTIKPGVQLNIGNMMQTINPWYIHSAYEGRSKLQGFASFDRGMPLHDITNYFKPLFVPYFMGVCYSFNNKLLENNSDPVLVGTGPIKRIQLHLLIDSHIHNHRVDGEVGSGYSLVIYPFEETWQMNTRQIYIKGGSVTDISLSMRMYDFSPPPHGKCGTSENGESHSTCLVNCATQRSYGRTQSRCNYSNVFDYKHPCPDFSSWLESLHWFWSVLYRDDFQKSMCSHCRPDCQKIEYGVFVADTAINPNCHIKEDGSCELCESFGYGNKIEEFHKDYAIINLAMESNSYEHYIQHPAYDWQGLMCDIGGSMGLFIGSALLTVFEILDVAIRKIV